MLNASNSVIKGIAMTGYNLSRFTITGNNNTISNFYLGTTPGGGAYGFNRGGSLIITNGASGNIIGGSTAADRNVLQGITLSNAGSGNIIKGNYIGINPTGTNALYITGNTTDTYTQLPAVINVSGSTPDVIIGGNNTGEGNVIGGSSIAISSTSSTFSAKIQGNSIGLNAAGTAPISAPLHALNPAYAAPTGITIGSITAASPSILIGTDGDGVKDANERNIISGNSNGINLLGGNGAIISGNYIGTDITGSTAIPNTGSGISVTNTVSGVSITKNNIGYNGGNGIVLAANVGTSNKISQNSIHDNGGLGIDLNADGVSANDAGDSDTRT